MRNVVAWLFVSLDGVAEAPEQWQFEDNYKDMLAAVATNIALEDTILLGRVTYEEWAPYWPTSNHEPYASHINTCPKYIVSTTLDRVEWGQFAPPTLVKGDLAETISRLKQQPGKRVSVAGSPTLVRTLLQADLLDELTLMVHPVIAGGGRRLFKDGDALKRLRLTSSELTGSGVAILTYQPRRENEKER